MKILLHVCRHLCARSTRILSGVNTLTCPTRTLSGVNTLTCPTRTLSSVNATFPTCPTRTLSGVNVTLLRGNNCVLESAVVSRDYSSDSSRDVLTEMPLQDPVKGELVYGGPLWKMIKGVKAFSMSTSILGLCLQPYILMNAGEAHVATKVAVTGTIGFFIFITPLMIHFVTKKYVRDCYYNRETGVFSAATYNIFVRRKEIQFKAEDVVVPDIPGMFTSIVAKGKPLFMDSKMFYSKEAYIHLMGYDKPMDWEMPDFSKKKK